MRTEEVRSPRASAVAFAALRPAALALALVVLPASSGCENEGPPPAARKKTTLEALPEPVRLAAKKALPDLTFDEAWENLDADRKVQSYEVRGHNAKGKIREARVSLDGKILEIE